MKDKGQLAIYAIFAIIVLIGIFFFAGEYLDTKKENQRLQASIAEYESVRVTMVEGANQLFRNLKQCRNEVEVLNG